MARTLSALAEDLASGRTSSLALTREALARIDAPEGEGRLAFVKVHRESALAAAEAMDRLRAAGLAPSPLAGIPISVKDLFDLAGEPTTAGSTVLADAPPALRDAPAIARLRAAGFVVIGRTNMTEFAFSGLGLNPHYGTPASPYDRAARRIPGGSSSGAAVSVADGMAFAGIGSDTGGSCRIPAAFCGIVGYKPTAASVPREGVFPLSQSLDSIGPLANSVSCCRALHEIMSGAALSKEVPTSLAGLRIAVPQTVALDGLDVHVAASFDRALERLAKAGAKVIDTPLERFAEVARINAKGGFAAAEAYAHHRALVEAKGEGYDPRVRTRILRGRNQDCADYIELLQARAAFVAAMQEEVAAFDVLAMPTVPTIAPTIAELAEDDEAFTRTNLLMLRNPTLINMMDGCSISLPMHRPGEAPAALMLSRSGGGDAALFAIAAAAEAALAGKD
ncbi:amidase [Bosea thiooxidans]|uniref:Amidase n=1 Tax=Bosea thiooxidans TaxID=53254 RepID=A0A0Q3PEZ7_9HYPH|nr:amidase [Bosea thiooxidans]KQK28326.1 amidase [Bosea thiooxidans]SKB56087.1 aspartyl-tRNA(Asn)/glutamyl-tRNA(Gln) amidotransferase subunit A [Bosea thiooxidans]